MSSAPCLSWLFYEDLQRAGSVWFFDRAILVEGTKPGLFDAVLQAMQCFINRSFNKGFPAVNLENYFPVLLFLLVGIGVGVLPQVLGRLIAPHRPDAAKLSPYECGFEAFEDARMKFDVRYYLVAILFILFDLETAFFFPWGVSMRDLGWPAFVTMMVFIAEFVVGFWYIWKKGALDWE
jgi:NADH-quinone oxidoreductase subunit A